MFTLRTFKEWYECMSESVHFITHVKINAENQAQRVSIDLATAADLAGHHITNADYALTAVCSPP